MVVGRWCTNHRYRAREVLEVVKETCQAVLLENVVGLAHADGSGRSNVDVARECFGELGARSQGECHIIFCESCGMDVRTLLVVCTYVRSYLHSGPLGRRASDRTMQGRA